MIPGLKDFLSITDDDLKQEAFLKKKEEVFFLCLNRKGNTFNQDFTRRINELLDEVQQNVGDAALVTVSTQKLFSGGLDLNVLMNAKHEMERSFFVLEVIRLFGRLTVFPVPTFALVNGSAVAAGCMIAFSHDEIYVYNKATFSCNEIEIGLPIPPGMAAVVKRKLGPKDYRDMSHYGKKFTDQEGLKGGFVDEVFSEDALEKVFQIAKSKSHFGGKRAVLKAIKEEENKLVMDACFNRQLDVGVRGEDGFKARL